MKFILQHCPVNPTLEYADSIVLPMGTTEIVSQGGGSTIDTGKWLARKYSLPHTVIPTTAGTGSEVTRYCVFSVNGVKTTFTDDRFIPTAYKLDPDLVISLPKMQTISTGLDALSQSLEALWSKNSTRESRQYSKLAIKLILKSLPESIKNPEDKVARMNMLIAANFSGRAINITKTNVCHALSYPLTDLYGIPHGIACGMSLAYFAKKAVGLDFESFIGKLELPKVSIDIDKIIDTVLKSDKLLDCRFKITKEDILTSLQKYMI